MGGEEPNISPAANQLINQIITKKGLVNPQIIAQQTPQQDNGKDCGVFVLAITKHLVDKYNTEPDNFLTPFSEEETRTIQEEIIPIRELLHARGLTDDEGTRRDYNAENDTQAL